MPLCKNKLPFKNKCPNSILLKMGIIFFQNRISVPSGTEYTSFSWRYLGLQWKKEKKKKSPTYSKGLVAVYSVHCLKVKCQSRMKWQFLEHLSPLLPVSPCMGSTPWELRCGLLSRSRMKRQLKGKEKNQWGKKSMWKL